MSIERTTGSPEGSRFSRVNRGPQSEIFTKFGDVKSRISWTAERRQQLREMWDRGDKAPDIAAAFGCKVGVINVARVRFGLKPRRIVSGRPKEPDEPTHKIERVAFTTSRLMEFCTEKELVAQTGHEAHKWPLVIVKELVDNAIDACEEAEVAPIVKITITTGKRGKPTRIIIEDNGPGIPTETITGIIDYNIRISSREAYIRPPAAVRAMRLRPSCRWPMFSAARPRARPGSRRAAASTASCSPSTRSSRSRSSTISGAVPG